ncbi:PepSY-associated TM helix domain-containing protein [Croceicoccus naphthovorans]|uniref:Uncharacterized protein n=1 Tax=Croceicoccus naphthovorans TaxID=1348774 RepID=A0A0G3XD30_9SPHN|nr:PepSY-associated TM helix domain-containing protein [Croceicoccus naphthovorans]AKM09480.1 hypothetical protein AB433_04980 [Croceicoccus naphthovorans]MBB3991510.1 putative iron-regulated membrane protein [Croceicoccus naphthovorans]
MTDPRSSRRSAPKLALRYHRRISVALLAFWLVQALTGMIMVFHWELDDALLPGVERSLDLLAMERSIDELAPEGSGKTVGSVWESGGVANRFDLYLDGPDGSSLVRVDGAGNVLRTRADAEMVADGGWISTLKSVHHNLLAGEIGDWIVGISGLFLFTNLILGLIAAWPRAGTWRRALLPVAGKGAKVAQTYAWHRAVGLWGVLPGLALAGSGVLLVFADTVEAIVQPPSIAAPDLSGEGDVGFAAAVGSALNEFPRARVSGVSMPSEDGGAYRIRLLQDSETRGVYGTTTLFVRASDGAIVARQDALNDGPSRSFVDGLFPFHTGHAGGTLGRMLVLAAGLWLVVMIALGLLLWQRRR